MKKRITRAVLKFVRPELKDLLRERLRAGEWQRALLLTDSQNRISLCVELLLRFVDDMDQWPDLLAFAISCGDNPAPERVRLAFLFQALQHRGLRIFDGDAARAAFETLPDQVTIYRGTVEAEGAPYGVCWTLDRDKAIWFATKHGRFRNMSSPPAILSATVNRGDIAGLLLERNESEVLICPNKLTHVTSESCPSAIESSNGPLSVANC